MIFKNLIFWHELIYNNYRYLLKEGMDGNLFYEYIKQLIKIKEEYEE